MKKTSGAYPDDFKAAFEAAKTELRSVLGLK